MKKEKILRAITEAKGFLDNSLKELTKDDFRDLHRNLWLVSSNIEYASFLISQALPENPNIKPIRDAISGKDPAPSVLIESLCRILVEAQANVKRGNLVEAYQYLKKAHQISLKVLTILERR